MDKLEKNCDYWMSVPTKEIRESVYERLEELGIKPYKNIYPDFINFKPANSGSFSYMLDDCRYYINGEYTFLSIHDLFYNTDHWLKKEVKEKMVETPKYGEVSMSTIETALKNHFSD